VRYFAALLLAQTCLYGCTDDANHMRDGLLILAYLPKKCQY